MSTIYYNNLTTANIILTCYIVKITFTKLLNYVILNNIKAFNLI